MTTLEIASTAWEFTSPINMTAKLLHSTLSLMGGVPTGPNDIGGMASTRAVVANMETAVCMASRVGVE